MSSSHAEDDGYITDAIEESLEERCDSEEDQADDKDPRKAPLFRQTHRRCRGPVIM
jgi:hypothetical protein